MDALSLALQWRRQRAARLDAQKQVDILEEAEKATKTALIARLSKLANKSVSNGERVIQLVTSDEPQVDDWPKLYKHIQKTGEFEFLHRRLNNTAVKERWEQKLKVPGVSPFPVETLSDTKAK